MLSGHAVVPHNTSMRKDRRYQWRRRETPRLRGVAAVTFAVDDSEVMIKGSRHLLLAAVAFHEPTSAVDAMARLRREVNVADDFEFKWNQKELPADAREKVADELRQVIGGAFGVVTLIEGTDRQRAAELLCEQIGELIEGDVLLSVVFDEAILRDERSFRRYLLASQQDAVRRIQFSVARSFAHDLVQCADLFAGFQNLKIRIALGEGKNRTVPGDFDDDEISLADLFEVSFRYVLWGQVVTKIDPEWISDDAPPPDWIFKETEGLGFRIHSSLDDETKELLYDEVGRPYFGCWH